MKVIYAKTVVEKIDDAIRDAATKRKTIQSIELTAAELAELKSSFEFHCIGIKTPDLEVVKYRGIACYVSS